MVVTRPRGPPRLTANARCLDIAQVNQRLSPLLRMPAEIRNRIYDLAMDTGSGDVFLNGYFGWKRLELSRTSRQVFAETAERYFHQKLQPLIRKKLLFTTPRSMVATTNRLTTYQRALVERIIINFATFHWSDKPRRFRDMYGFRYLEEITIVAPMGEVKAQSIFFEEWLERVEWEGIRVIICFDFETQRCYGIQPELVIEPTKSHRFKTYSMPGEHRLIGITRR